MLSTKHVVAPQHMDILAEHTTTHDRHINSIINKSKTYELQLVLFIY